MKRMHVIVLAGVMAYVPGAVAESTVDAAKLGRMQGILNVCTRVNPREASHYLLQIKAMIGDASRQAVEQAARTDEYRQAYQAVTDELRNMPPDEMAKACNEYLAASG